MSPSAATPTTVPMVSKKSASIRVNTSSRALITPTLANDPPRLKSPMSPKSGLDRILSGTLGTLRLQPLGL